MNFNPQPEPQDDRVHIPVHMDTKLRDQIRAEAKKRDMSMAAFCRQAIMFALQNMRGNQESVVEIQPRPVSGPFRDGWR